MDALRALRSMGMGGRIEGVEGDKMVKQAEHIWSMLDDMADQDPQAYSRFIEKQTREYKEMKAPPQPHMCIRTQFQGTPLYVNVVSWQRVPKPKSPQDNIPLFAAPLENIVDKKSGETVSTIAIATNPEVLAECGAEAKNAEERRSFIELTLDYVQHLTTRSVDRNFTLLPRSVQFKGDLEKAQKHFTDALKKAMKKDQPDNLGTESETDMNFAPDDMDIPESMLSKLASISTSGTSSGKQSQGASSLQTPSSNNAPVIFPEARKEEKRPISAGVGAGKKNLIQELRSEEVRLTKPEYTLEEASSPGGCLCLVMSMQLPGVTSVSQCELDISEDDVKLYVEGRYELTVQLPSRIDDGDASAKFSKRQSVLTLTMPIADS